MKILHGLEGIHDPIRPCILTIGNFDGVHLAHQALLAQCCRLAADCELPVTVLTFEPHPLTVVAPAKAPQRLMPLDEKLRRLEEAGADVTVVARSEPALLGLKAEAFVEDVIRRRMGAAHIVEGPTFGFGRGRKGTTELLARIVGDFGCTLHIAEPVSQMLDSGETVLVSSSLIRGLIGEGRVSEAARCLGRDYSLFGTVVRGQGRGKGLGFPTANVAPVDQVVPGDGVYAGKAVLPGREFPCAISIGHTPTFEGRERQVEAYLLDFTDDLYRQPLTLRFRQFLRKQQVFNSAEALREQLCVDVAAVRGLSTAVESAVSGHRNEAMIIP